MKRIVTGHILYNNRGYDWFPGELFTIGYLGRKKQVNIDNLTPGVVMSFLNECGVPSSAIKVIGVFGNSTTDMLEIFFAYEGVLPTRTVDLFITNSHHKSSNYAIQDGLIVPAFQNILSGLETELTNLAINYEIKSFMVKPFELPGLPKLVIAKKTKDGVLADMRWMNSSYKYLADFKKLNWKTIIVKNENGTQSWHERPKTGW